MDVLGRRAFGVLERHIRQAVAVVPGEVLGRSRGDRGFGDQTVMGIVCRAEGLQCNRLGDPLSGDRAETRATLLDLNYTKRWILLRIVDYSLQLRVGNRLLRNHYCKTPGVSNQRNTVPSLHNFD